MSGISGRARFPRPTAALGAAAAALAVLAASGCGGSDGDDGATTVEPESTYADVVQAAEPPAPEGYKSVDINKIKVDAPEDWSVDTSGGKLCMRPPGQDSCGYGAIQVLPNVAKKDPKNWPKKDSVFNKDNGWASTPDTCRSLNTAKAGDVGVKSAKLQPLKGDGTAKLADGLKAHHRAWEVTCENDDTFEVRLWFLPKTDVAVYAWSVDTQYASVYDEVGASLDTSAFRKAKAEKEKKEKEEKEKDKDKKDDKEKKD